MESALSGIVGRGRRDGQAHYHRLRDLNATIAAISLDPPPLTDDRARHCMMPEGKSLVEFS